MVYSLRDHFLKKIFNYQRIFRSRHRSNWYKFHAYLVIEINYSPPLFTLITLFTIWHNTFWDLLNNNLQGLLSLIEICGNINTAKDKSQKTFKS